MKKHDLWKLDDNIILNPNALLFFNIQKIDGIRKVGDGTHKVIATFNGGVETLIFEGDIDDCKKKIASIEAQRSKYE